MQLNSGADSLLMLKKKAIHFNTTVNILRRKHAASADSDDLHSECSSRTCLAIVDEKTY